MGRVVTSKIECGGDHRYFVAETGLDAEGRIVVILVCTACGDPLKHEFTVESKTYQLQSSKEN